jgi:hypothetical protein
MFVVSNPKDCFDEIKSLLEDDKPIFLGRMGGSDTNAVASLIEAQDAGDDIWRSIFKHRTIVSRLNGFYDKSNSRDQFIRYLGEMRNCYAKVQHAFLCNHQLLSMYFAHLLGDRANREQFAGRLGLELLIAEVEAAQKSFTCYPYSVVERLSLPLSLLNIFGTVLYRKTVLVISPFEASITKNSHNLNKVFKSFKYPEFKLKVYRTPITYDGLPMEFYPHQNWFETVEQMKSDIETIPFDIALLSCGSYAMPLGCFIAENLNRKAIYVGGVLQLMFGIMGRRYENPFFMDQLNLDKCIYPVEADTYLHHVRLSPEMAREAFAAYF